MMLATSTYGINQQATSLCMNALVSPHITPSGARLTLIRPGSGYNWLLIPGGPGLGSDYMLEFARRLPLRGSIWRFDYPGTFSSEFPMSVEVWKKSFVEALSVLDNPIPIAHSFGGMLLLSTENVRALLQALVLIATSPSDEWLKVIASEGIQTEEMTRMETEFSKRPANGEFARLFKAWAPYYFTDAGMADGLQMMDCTTYCADAYVMGRDQFFAQYKRAAWLPDDKLPTLVIAGAEDKVTPLKLFDGCAFLSSPLTRVASVPHAGHFPWIENPERVIREFEDFDRALHR